MADRPFRAVRLTQKATTHLQAEEVTVMTVTSSVAAAS